MKEITLTFDPDELCELAKQLYLASNLLMNCGYDNQKMADDLRDRVCAVGFLELPEMGAFRPGGHFDPPFTLTHDVDKELITVLDIYNDEMVAEHVPYALADRDFEEKYGHMEPEDILRNPKLLNELEAIQKVYKEEFERYGVRNLRLVKND